MKNKVYDVIGIGIGPFNLGLAALIEPLSNDLSSLFFDQSDDFNWHPGLMLDSTTLQVPFMADLVTLADPTSKFSFLNYLKENDRIYKFYIRENFLVLRKEFNIYCRWVINQLNNCKFKHRVLDIRYIAEKAIYEIIVEKTETSQKESFFSKNIVLGTGPKPYFPCGIKGNSKNIIHSSNYLDFRDTISSKKNVTIIGSGQSAAEIFYDLLPNVKNKEFHLNWFTRPNRFFAMEYSKLTLELTSPEYVDYFYKLPHNQSQDILNKQKSLYKGINYDLINQIYDDLYEMSINNKKLNVRIQPNSSLKKIEQNQDKIKLDFKHTENHKEFSHITDFVILSTGFSYDKPSYLKNIDYLIDKNEGNYNVSREYTMNKEKSIFAQNIETYNHGFVTPDLGMGAYRNSIIINQLMKKEIYIVEKSIAFQRFNV